MHHPFLKHARNVITSRLNGLNWRDQWDGEATRPSKGCFVSLKKGSSLRGCIGTLEPVRPTLEEEIASNALSAAARDPRFSPVILKEMENISISIDILEMPEPVDSPGALEGRVASPSPEPPAGDRFGRRTQGLAEYAGQGDHRGR